MAFTAVVKRIQQLNACGSIIVLVAARCDKSAFDHWVCDHIYGELDIHFTVMKV